MKQQWSITAALTVLMINGTITVNAMEPEYYIGGKASTLGLGVEAGARVTPDFGVRVNGNYLSLSRDFDTDDVNYNGDVDLESIGAMIDWYPMQENFYLSAGVYYNGNEASVVGRANQNVTLGGTTYTPAQLGEVRGNVEANEFAPYIGIGYQEKITSSFSLGAELGAMYTGKYTSSLSTNSPFVSQADLQAEEQNLNDEIDHIRFWPVVGIRAGYHF